MQSLAIGKFKCGAQAKDLLDNGELVDEEEEEEEEELLALLALLLKELTGLLGTLL